MTHRRSPARRPPPLPIDGPPLVVLPRVDGVPHRPWASLNIRHAEKLGFDVVHSWLCLTRGERLSQWDAFSIMWADFLERADLPPVIVEQIALKMAAEGWGASVAPSVGG